MTPWTVAHQAPLSMELPRQEYWNRLPFPFLNHLPNPGILLHSLLFRLFLYHCITWEGTVAGSERGTISVPGSRRSPGVENGNPLQYSYLGNPMVRGACKATVHEAAESQTQLTEHTTNIIKQAYNCVYFMCRLLFSSNIKKKEHSQLAFIRQLVHILKWFLLLFFFFIILCICLWFFIAAKAFH